MWGNITLVQPSHLVPKKVEIAEGCLLFLVFNLNFGHILSCIFSTQHVLSTLFPGFCRSSSRSLLFCLLYCIWYISFSIIFFPSYFVMNILFPGFCGFQGLLPCLVICLAFLGILSSSILFFLLSECSECPLPKFVCVFPQISMLS